MTFEQYLIDKNITDLSPHIKALMLKAWEAATEAEASKYKPISVDEQLPEQDDPNQYIIYTEPDDCCVGHFEFGDWFDGDGLYMEDVTHWLPTPRLPI